MLVKSAAHSKPFDDVSSVLEKAIASVSENRTIEVTSHDAGDLAAVLKTLMDAGETFMPDFRRSGDQYENRITGSAPHFWNADEGGEPQDRAFVLRCNASWLLM